MTSEKRKYERYDISGVVEAKGINILKAINVSLSGIRVLTETKLDRNHVIDITFTMPGITNIFAAQAKVVWQKETETENLFDTGFVFNKINVVKAKD